MEFVPPNRRTAKRSSYIGFEGATSLKEEIVGQIPVLNHASHFRRARQLIRDELGGVRALRDELIIAGFVEPQRPHLLVTSGPAPQNVFAQLVVGSIKQPTLEKEQAYLGEFADRFLVCRNRPAAECQWDSNDPQEIQRASMSFRHRFLTTRDLSWEWFNALAFGLDSHAEDGCGIAKAVEEVKAMKTAAMLFAKNCPGWSNDVGLFVNVFGHNKVNSLFVHILDMSCLGPSFEANQYKNCPLDDVLKVLEEEAAAAAASQAAGCAPSPASSMSPSTPATPTPLVIRRRTGAGAATSMKADTVEMVPKLSEAGEFRTLRRLLLQELGGLKALHQELVRAGFIDNNTSLLTTGTQPFNLFARLGSGVMKQPGMEKEQEYLGGYRDRYVICCNLPDNDSHWDSTDPQWVGKASMSRHHRFLTTKDLHWQWFNALVIGLVPNELGGVEPAKALKELEDMRDAALTYARAAGWSDSIGLFFHVYGHNSVNSLHLHIVDLSVVGPTFLKLSYKNCPLEAVVQVIREEISLSTGLEDVDSCSNAKVQVQKASKRLSKTLKVDEVASVSVAPPVQTHWRQDESESDTSDEDEDLPPEILELNIGGCVLTVSRAVMILAPKESRLYSIFCTKCGLRDPAGRVFYDFPPRAFERIIGFLRLLHLNPDLEWPPSAEADWEFWELTRILGVASIFNKNKARA